jgi:predicted dehydrogenase
VAVADVSPANARDVARIVGAEVVGSWRDLLDRSDVDCFVVSTPNAFLEEITVAALRAGKHVLVEKPMGRNLDEARRMCQAACAGGRLLKVGFNHRYHPAIAEAHRRARGGQIGDLINIRCRYGHGGRPGYEKEWRGSRELAGGGELTDQGVHVADLIHWFAGEPVTAFGCLQTAVWPLGDLEDNGFGLFKFGTGVIASFHTSWTQWKNLFSLEVFGTRGALIVEGLGRSYGTERLNVVRRRLEGGVPEIEEFAFDGEDSSWQREWEDFLDAVLEGREPLGSANDGVVAMKMLDALYRSHAAYAPVQL